jgi:hypothetical protein
MAEIGLELRKVVLRRLVSDRGDCREMAAHEEAERKKCLVFLRKALPLLVQLADLLDGELQPVDLGRDDELVAVPGSVKIAFDYEETGEDRQCAKAIAKNREDAQ